MGIEQLNKAVELAGYAMATDDDASVDSVPPEQIAAAHPLVMSGFVQNVPQPNSWGWDYLTAATGWVRGHLPSIGGRAPA